MEIQVESGQDPLKARKQAEAQYYDHVAEIRTVERRIPAEADMRRATRVVPKGPGDLQVDPKMIAILTRRSREMFIDQVAHRPGGRVLDICCGSGWLALELGRRGQKVDAYDLSPRAIGLAKRMLEENPYREGFGEVNYHLGDVTAVDLGENTYDAVSGWAAFHHLPDLDGFMKRVVRALKPGGVVATYDDMPRGRVERSLEYVAKFALPLYTVSFPQKVATIVRRLTGRTPFRVEGGSPMEEEKGSTVYDIARLWHEHLDVFVEYRQDAFASTPLTAMSGPDWIRYPTAHALVALDAAMCRLGLVQGFDRFMIGRKRP